MASLQSGQQAEFPPERFQKRCTRIIILVSYLLLTIRCLSRLRDGVVLSFPGANTTDRIVKFPRQMSIAPNWLSAVILGNHEHKGTDHYRYRVTSQFAISLPMRRSTINTESSGSNIRRGNAKVARKGRPFGSRGLKASPRMAFRVVQENNNVTFVRFRY
jgi:hypothetical protein